MLAALAHRGPDDEGLYVDQHMAMGYRRLAVIDLRDVANQPMPNEDGSVQAVYNGEIYNFQELRAALTARGHSFRSSGDTETIVHLYEERGAEFVHELRGMFAIAVWDAKRRTLILARDRLGEKPLFFVRTPEVFAFASEIKGLLAGGFVPRLVDPIAVDQFLSLHYVPAPRTGFKDIEKLRAGCTLTVNARAVAAERRYWSLDYEPKLTLSHEDAGCALLELLRQSVRLRMISDVPLGAFLSGGIDSSSVVALMAEQTDRVKTFSIGFNEPRFDELRYARMVASHFGTDHHEAIVEPDAIRDVPRIVWQYDQPYADVSAIPTYYVSQLASRHVRVALNGDGGDETFAGYPRYGEFLLTSRIDQVPERVRKVIGRLGEWALGPIAQHTYIGRRLHAIAEGTAGGMEERYAAWVTAFRRRDKERLLSPEFRSNLGTARGIEPLLEATRRSKTTLDRLLELDSSTNLPDDLLVKVDIASMAWSLECRSPYLDHEVVEFAAHLPPELKLSRGMPKRLLRDVFRQQLPPGIVDRRKQGFGVPIGDWLRHELRDYAQEILLGPRAQQRGLFSTEAIAQLVDEHQSGRFNHSSRLWPLLVLEIWQRTFIDSNGAQPLTLG